MTNFVKILLILFLPQVFMVNMDMGWVLNSPFPSHDGEIRIETNGIDYVGTHIERGNNSSSHKSIFFYNQVFGLPFCLIG